MFSKFKNLAVCLLLVAGLAACDSQSTEEKVDAFLQSAAEKAKAGELDAAVIELKNALQLSPDHALARRNLGAIYLERGQGKSAAKEFRRALEHGAKSPSVETDLVRALLLAREYDEAIKETSEFETSGDLSKPLARTMVGLQARARLAKGEVDAAEAMARRVLGAGDAADARLVLAQIHGQRGEPKVALEHADAVLQERPDDTEALLVRALSLAQLGDANHAIETLKAARDQPWRPAQIDLTLIQLAIQTNDTKLAWSVLDDLTESFPEDPRVRFYVGVRALEEKDYKKAREIGEALAGQYPDFAQGLLIAGAGNLGTGNHELARSYLERFLRRHPDHRQGRIMLAQAWQGLGKKEEARKLLRGLDGGRAPGRQVANADHRASDADPVDPSQIDTPSGMRQEVQSILEKVQAGDFDAAMTSAKAMQEKLPDSTVPQQLQSIVLWAQGKQDEAITHLERALEAAPATPELAINLARMHRARNEPEAARQALKPVLDAHPDNVDARVEMARIYAMQNDPAAVQSQLETAVKTAPSNAGVRAFLARFHLLQNRPQQALEVVQAAPADQGDNPDLLEVRGRAHQALGNLELALSAFRKLQRAASDRPDGYLRTGETLLAANRPADAVGPLETAREKAAEPKEAGIYLARALLQSGQSDRAGQVISELEDKYPQESDVAILRGNYQLSVANDPDAAVASFERALELEPSERRLMDLVQLQAQLGRVEPAMAKLQDWRKTHPDSVTVDAALAELHLGRGQLDQAAELYRSLATRAPDNPAYHNNLAWVLGEQGQLDSALQHAETAQKLAPGDPSVLDTLGVIRLKRGDTQEAVRHLGEAANAAPARADIQVHYAEALVAADDRGRAREVLSRLQTASLPAGLKTKVEELRARTATQ